MRDGEFAKFSVVMPGPCHLRQEASARLAAVPGRSQRRSGHPRLPLRLQRRGWPTSAAVTSSCLGWAKARLRAVPTIFSVDKLLVGTLRFAHPGAASKQEGWQSPTSDRSDLPRLLHRVFQARCRRAGLERLLLTFMRRPAGEPDDVEGGADATVAIGETFGINLGHA